MTPDRLNDELRRVLLALAKEAAAAVDRVPGESVYVDAQLLIDVQRWLSQLKS